MFIFLMQERTEMSCWGFCKWSLFSTLHLKVGSKLREWGNQCPLVLSHEANTCCDFPEGEQSTLSHHKLSTCTQKHRRKCVYANVYLLMAEPAVCKLTSVMQTCMCRAGEVYLLINTAPNTVIPPLLLTPVCKTMILVKILQGTSHAGQLLFLSLFRIVFHCSAKSSPNLKQPKTFLLLTGKPVSPRQEQNKNHVVLCINSPFYIQFAACRSVW